MGIILFTFAAASQLSTPPLAFVRMADAHAVFLNMAATGHVNPTLPVASELRSRGAQVTYFAPESIREVVEATGANWRYAQAR